jgi:hypothetical protein
MRVSTLAACVGLELLLLGAVTRAADPPTGSPPVLRVSVYNDAAVPSGTLQQAEFEASRIFRQGGVEVVWMHCSQDSREQNLPGLCAEAYSPGHLHLRVLKASRGVNPSTLGLSFLSAKGEGCYADLFYAPMVGLQRTDGVPPAVSLGHALAHELGHLLLGTNSHSSQGLMRARWDRGNLEEAMRGNLLFSSAESNRISNRLAAGDRMALASNRMEKRPNGP